MRKLREVFQLIKVQKFNQTEVSRALNIGRGSVQDYLSRYDLYGLTPELLLTMNDLELEQYLYPKKELISTITDYSVVPDWEHITQELGRKGVTLKLLWEEFQQTQPKAVRYSQFCDIYRRHKQKLGLVMRQEYKGGEWAMVDYSGDKPFYKELHTGQLVYCDLFVMAWAASNYIYCEGQKSQELQHWCLGHQRAFQYFGCAPFKLIPDNLKSGVTQAHRYDPDLNPTFANLCHHYNIAVLPARPYKPRDKGKVENAVLQVQRWILASLRDQEFYSLDELNQNIRKLMEQLNNKPMVSYGNKSRKELFDTWDKPAAQALAEQPWELKKWLRIKVGIDYCVSVDGHFYSVPYQYSMQTVMAVISERMIELYANHERIAIHPISDIKGTYSILEEHRPEKHKKVLAWTPERLSTWAMKSGPHTKAYVQALIQSKYREEEGYRPVLGILRLAENAGCEMAEAASRFALEQKMFRVSQYGNILKSPLFKNNTESDQHHDIVVHKNLHGMQNYKEEA